MKLEDLQAEIAPFKNTLVIDTGYREVVRLVDVEDGEEDFYYIFDGHKGLYGVSCVGGFIPLKGFIPKPDYDRLVNQWNYNSVYKAE